MSAENRLKSCLVLGGEYRLFDTSGGSIRKFADINQLDIYCHLWSTDPKEIDNVKEVLQPKRMLAENPLHYKPIFLGIEERIKSKNPKGPNQDKLWQNASMHFSRKRAFDLVQEEYEFCYFSRYDVLLGEFKIKGNVVGVITPKEQSYNLISDIFAVFPFSVAQHYFLYDVYEKLHSTPFEESFVKYLKNVIYSGDDESFKIHMEQRYCPHVVLLRNLFLHSVPCVLLDIPVFLLRVFTLNEKSQELYSSLGIE
jgi:hypothetical protein